MKRTIRLPMPSSGEVRNLLFGLLICAGLMAIDKYVGSKGYDYAGPLLFLKHLFELAAVLALFAICAAIGRLVLSRIGILLKQPIEALVFSISVGSGIIGTLVLLLGLAGGLQKLSLGILFLLLALVACKELNAVSRLTVRALVCIRESGGGWVTLVLCLTSLAAAAFFLIILASAPPVDWDSLKYHLRVPSQFLEEGRIYLPEDNLHVSRVGLAHMLYLPLLALGSSAGPALVNAFLALLLGMSVFSLATRFFGHQTASLSLTLLWGTTTILLVAISPRVDVTLGFFVFLAHYALLIALSSESNMKFLYLGAILLGFAVGIKYLALLYVIGLAPLVIWVAVLHTRSLTSSLQAIMKFGLLVLMAAFPWLAKNWLLLGAPLYPFLCEPKLPLWLVSLSGSEKVPLSVNKEIFQLMWKVRVPFNIRDAFLAPGQISIEAEGALYYTNPLLLLLPLWVLFIKNRKLTWLVIPALAYLLVLLVPFPRTNLRYLVPAAAPLTIVVAYLVSRACDRVLSMKAGPLFVVVLMVFALLQSIRAGYIWLSGTEALRNFVGLTSTSKYLATHHLPEVRVYAELIRLVNSQLPQNSRILMLFEGRGYYLNPRVIQENKATNWPLLAAVLTQNECLAKAEITHVLVNSGSLRYFMDGGLDPAIIGWDTFQDFVDRCLSPIYKSSGYVLYRVK